ncbi:hypothetical protein KSP40_PGU021903 [Platanthera guangdongensis]|uniref:Uncharacterized protein n=1 Tax=Platanthera guangdongensis TaxID=2320717 RepID=A0ABR2LVA1_9ASPA
MEERRLPTMEDVMKKMKEDGDFDSLRVKIVRVVKENEDLRNRIIELVKQSNVINQDGSEDMKPRQLSDAIFEELGMKITGQISDEVWKIIRSNDSIKNDIRSTAESAFNRLANIEPQGGREGTDPSPLHEDQFVRAETSDPNTSSAIPMIKTNMLIPDETNDEPSKPASDGHPVDNSGINLEVKEHEQGSVLWPQRGFQHSPIQSEAVTSGFDSSHVGGEAEDESDLPPGFD